MTVTQSHDNRDNSIIAELRQLRRELADYREASRLDALALHKLFTRFAAVYLDCRFPFGKEIDGFRRPTGRYR